MESEVFYNVYHPIYTRHQQRANTAPYTCWALTMRRHIERYRTISAGHQQCTDTLHNVVLYLVGISNARTYWTVSDYVCWGNSVDTLPAVVLYLPGISNARTHCTMSHYICWVLVMRGRIASCCTIYARHQQCVDTEEDVAQYLSGISNAQPHCTMSPYTCLALTMHIHIA